MAKLKYSVVGIVTSSEVYSEVTVYTQRDVVKILLHCLGCPVESMEVTVAKIEDEKYFNLPEDELLKILNIRRGQVVEIDEKELAKDNEIVKEDFYKQNNPYNRSKRYRKKRNMKMLNDIRRQLLGTHKLKILN